jgi:hypothetical protein
MFGSMLSIMKFSIFMYYTYTFFIGSIFISNGKFNSKSGELYSAEDVLSILIAFITGFVTLVGALPNIQSLMATKVAGKYIFDVIDRQPRI